MTDLTNILGGAWSPPKEYQVKPAQDQFADAIISQGWEPPDQIIMDGQIHRFNTGVKKRDKTGWYVVFGDGVPAGKFGCWREGIEQSFTADIGRDLSPVEQMAHAKRLNELRSFRAEQQKKQYEAAANTVDQIWTNAHHASPDHPYLKAKGIDTNGARVTGDGRLVLPLYNHDGELSSLQYIDHDGGKLYHSGGKTGGCFWWIGDFRQSDKVFIAEGFATAATIHDVTGVPVIIAFSANNLTKITGYFADHKKVIVADNDESGVGKKSADEAAAKFGAIVIVPPDIGDANDYYRAGGDLATLLNPVSDDWLISADEFCQEPSPISWLIKRWVQDEALIMVHGQSGAGKTFVILDWLLRIASDIDDWNDCKVNHGNVVYLAGEGHHGLKGRIAAWKKHHGIDSVNMWVSQGGCDLNTPEGYMRVSDHIQALPDNPRIIAVDTLHRFLDGDENSAQDAKTMLDYCARLMAEFNCTVLLVHHTGVSDEAQHRARGSSAWRGALDIEVSVMPSRNDDPMQIIQRKSKDAELAESVYVDLQSIAIDGWIDDDGEQVTSAVIIDADPPAKNPTTSELKSSDIFKRAWFNSGCETDEGSAYVSRSAMIEFMVNNLNKSESTADRYCKPSATRGVIYDMINANIIAKHRHGWLCIDDVTNSQMILSKN